MPRRRCLVAVGCVGLSVLMTASISGGCPGAPGGSGGVLGFNLPPTVRMTADIVRGIAPLLVQFNSSNSTDDGLIVRRVWNFGDGQTSQEISPTHTFSGTGEFEVRLTLTDDVGATATRSIVIAVTLAPQARIIADRTAAESAPAVFNFDGSSSIDPDGEIVLFEWDFGDGSGELLPIVPHTYGRPGTFRVRLTVTDNTGVTATDEVIIEVGIRQPSIAFRSPTRDVSNIVVSQSSPLWIHTVFEVQQAVPHTITAGLDLDLDACDANTTLFDPNTGAELRMLEGHDEPVTALAYSPDGARLATASSDRTVRIYSTSTGLTLQILGGHTAGINAVAFSSDGTQVLTGGDDNKAIIHSAGSGAEVNSFSVQTDVTAVAFSPVGNAVLIGVEVQNDPDTPAEEQPLALLLNAFTGVEIANYTGHSANVVAVAFSPDGSRVVTGSVDKTARIWDRDTGFELLSLVGHSNTVTSVAYYSDGQDDWVLTGSSDFTIRLWDASTGLELQVFDGHTDRVTSVAFSPDGSQALSGSADGTARIWNLATGEQIRSVSSCISAVSAVAFSPDGTQIASGVAAQNSIQLDVIDRPSGNDLDLQVPAALGLASVPPGARYFLWAEIDTDRTAPVRTYSHVQVNVISPFTQVIEDGTPQAVFDQNDSAAIIPSASSARQIIGLGGLKKGDRLFLSLLNTPGYGSVFNIDQDFSVLILDDSTDPGDPTMPMREMLVWYQSDFTLFTRETRLVVSRDSNYFLVLDGNPSTRANTPAVSIRIESGFGDTPRRQTVFLDFRGQPGLSVAGLDPFTVPVFNASDVKSGWGATETAIIKTKIVETVEDLYVNGNGDPFDLVVVSSDDGPSPGPSSLTVFFGGDPTDPDAAGAFGVADYLDPRNDTLTGSAVVFTKDLGNDVFPGATADQMGAIIGKVAVHEIAHLLGLRHTVGSNDIMAAGNPADPLTFQNSPISGIEQFNGQIGFQNAPRYLEEVLGLRP